MKKFLKIGLIVVLLFAGAGGWWFWKIYYQPVVHVPGQDSEFLFVRTGTTMPELVQQLYDEKIIRDTSSFNLIAGLKKFTAPKPGRYRVKDGMNNRELVNMLRSGMQEPVHFAFNNLRTKEQLAGRVGNKLEADSAQFLFLLNDPGFLSKYGMSPQTVMTMFIPNTYDLFWNTSAEQFFDRMAQEYKKFWTADRKTKAQKLGLSQSEVIILASIVEAEQSRFADERPCIAGLYINRLHRGMKLESDPTVIYALGDFSIQRLTNDDLQIDSPYNTYRHTGLPPGPIRMPEVASIDAVLNYQDNKYIFMCAEFGTGRHKFAETLDEHNRNARLFHQAEDKAGIKR